VARSHYRGTVYGNLVTGAKPLPGAAISLFHPDTGAPWALPVYPDPVNGVPYALPIHTNAVGELELWADQPARVRAAVSHPKFYSAGEVIEIRPDPEQSATDEDISQSVADHEAELDPHQQYLTQDDGDLRYKPLGYQPDLSGYYTKGEAEAAFLDQGEGDLRYEQLTKKGASGGYAPLDGAGLIPPQYLPPLAVTDTFVCASEAEMLALVAQTGDVAIRVDEAKTYILADEPATAVGNWVEMVATSGAGNVSVVQREEFAPAAASTAVVLTNLASEVLSVSRNGVEQSALAGHYTLAGQSLTFTDPFVAGERVGVVYETGAAGGGGGGGMSEEDADLRYLQLTGGALSGALSILGKPVAVSPDADNGLEWRANGLYGGAGGAPPDLSAYYTKTEADARYSLVAHDHAGVYSLVAHNHDAAYSLLAHTHTGTYATPTDVSTAVTNHAGAADPHSTYLNNTRGDARYSLTGHTHAGVYAPVAHNHDGTYAPTVHNHDGAYYTEAEADARFLQLTGGTISGAMTFNGGATHSQRLTVAGGVQPKITVNVSAPGSPATGDLWIW
jgi:hypothetical protein